MAQLPGRPFQRLKQNFQARNPNGIGGLLSGGTPLFDFGVGLLASSGPRAQGTSNFGSRLGEATQFASARERAALQNELVRQQMRARQRQQDAAARLPGLLADTSVVQGEGSQVSGLNGELLGTIPGRQAIVPAIQTPEGRQRAIGILSAINPEAASGQILSQLFAQPQRPTGTEATLQAVEGRVGPLSPEQVMQIAGGGTTINVGTSKLDEPLSTSDLNRVRLPDGSPVPIGTTAREAQEAGARVFSEAELKQQRDVAQATNTLNSLEQMALHPETGVFVDNGGSPLTNNVLARLGNGILNGLGAFRGTDASVRRSVYNATAQGSIASLLRSMGDSGALAEGDVARGLALIPQLGATPATEREARAQFSELRQIISRGVDELGGQEAANTHELGGGVTLRFLD